MSDFYIWDQKTIGLDIKEMDDEHVVLISKMNALHKAHSEKLSANLISQKLEDFASYTLKHFSDEEAYMAKINYSGLTTHKIIHKRLLNRVNDFAKEFEKSGLLSEEFFSFLSVWLTAHIRGIDFKYANKSR